METKKLKEISQIFLSNVDKKKKHGEKDVYLCNFVDVYYNQLLDELDVPLFLKASASSKEIEKFTLYQNDVCITKDSETKDDIGISCLIYENLSNTVLGYHCALIRPNPQVLDGSFLNYLLNTPYAKKYFSFRASGSGQRYTLSLDNIGNIEIPQFELSKQKKIGSLLNHINKKIKLNKRINDNLFNSYLFI